MTTSVLVKHTGPDLMSVHVETVSLKKGGPTTMATRVLNDGESVEIALHDGAMLYISEQPLAGGEEAKPQEAQPAGGDEE
jgi:hypothetical protein